MKRLGFQIVFIIFLIFFTFRCASTVRRYTYPPDFAYVPQNQVHSAMWKLALGVANINKALNQDDPLGLDRKTDVIAQLKMMLEAARTLDKGAIRTNHPNMEERIGEFVSDLERARLSASLAPPNYYLAGRISGTCSSCHTLRP